MRNSTIRTRLGFAAALFCLTGMLLGANGPKQPSADEALSLLQAGNERYVQHRLQHPDQSLQRMHEVEAAQHPFAVVLGCADSRVPPEIVFDQGLGDLFVIRVAGVVPDDEVIGSIEYAVEHLHVALVVVLGHERCGAVTAATEVHLENDHMGSFLNALKPYVEEAKAKSKDGDLVHNAVCVSVDRIVEQLRGSQPVLEDAVLAGKLRVMGARYDLHTGKVIWQNGTPSVPSPSKVTKLPSESE